MEQIAHVFGILQQTSVYLFTAPTSRVYAPFLIAGLALAALVAIDERKAQLQPHQRLFSKESWLSVSARNDYSLVMFNALLMAFLFAPLLVNSNALAAALAGLAGWVVPLNQVETPLWLAAFFAFCLFLVDDFVRYAVHYMEHRIPFLWELHKVHHSAEVLNFATADRHHPLAVLIFASINATMIALVNAAFLIVFQNQISMTTLLGGNIFWVASNLLGGTLRHSPVWLSFGPKVERWFISPAQHQVHHSSDAKHFDCNFGSSLALWDRMFGTLYTTSNRREDISFGLGDETPAYRALGNLYWAPLRNAFAQLRPAKEQRA